MKKMQSYDLYVEDILGINSNSDRKDQNSDLELTDSMKGQSQFTIKNVLFDSLLFSEVINDIFVKC